MGSEAAQPNNRFKADSINIDADARVDETSEYLTVEPVTVAREGVFLYEDGRAYKPGDELAEAAEFARAYIAWDHPPLKVITRPAEIKGFADNIHAEKDGKGVKVKARLTFYKKRLTQDQQELIRSKIRRDVSVGFYYEEDRTPGIWNGQAYDYVQRNFVFDHVASVDHGRCSYPVCGIGVDTEVQIGNDPYPNEHSCRMKDPSEFQSTSFRRITRGKVSLIIGKLKGEKTTTLQAFRYPKTKWSEAAARAHCAKAGGSFEAASSDQGDGGLQKIDDGLQKFNPKDVNLRRADNEAAGEECENCIFYQWQTTNCRIVDGPIGPDLVCDEFTARGTIEDVVRAMRGKAGDLAAEDAQLTYQQELRLPDKDFAYISPDGKRKLPIHDRAHVVAALEALQGARGGVDLPASARAEVKRKVCARAKSYGIKSPYCDAGGDAAVLLRHLREMDHERLVDFHRAVHQAEDFVPEGILHRAVLFALKKAR